MSENGEGEAGSTDRCRNESVGGPTSSDVRMSKSAAEVQRMFDEY